MKTKIKDIFAAMLGIIGFFISFGIVGRMETDMYFPFAKGVALIFAGFMLIGMGFALGRWDRC